MSKITLAYVATGTVAVGGAGIGGYIYLNKDTSKEQKQEKRSISEALIKAGKTVLSTVAGSSNGDEEEGKRRQTAYGTVQDGELITDVEASGQETSIPKSASVDIEKMKKGCAKYSTVEFTSVTDATYKKVLKWCTKEAQ